MISKMIQRRESVGIERVSSLQVFVRDLERSRQHYIENLDFAETAVSTPAFEMEQRARASIVEAGGARFVFMEPLGSKGESFRWLEKHPEGVGRIVFQVKSAEKAFALLVQRGATPVTELERSTDGESAAIGFDIATPIGDTLFRFVEHSDPAAVPPGFARHRTPRGGSNRFGITGVDHITSNFLTLKPAILWMEQVMGLERYWGIEFHTQDVNRELKQEVVRDVLGGSGLKSEVMWDPESGVKLANNEPAAPAFKSSQIYLFCEDHRGAGVQHVALGVADILTAVAGIRGRGAEFMPTPDSYYDMLPARLCALGVNDIDEGVEQLRALQILVDGNAPGRYLLQVFMREAASLFKDSQAGPLFVELIQRKGDAGFGGGNFRALFESIEREQLSQGARLNGARAR